jgi:hypothetical protein
MIFGDTNNFAIEAYHEPSGPEWHGFGRLCLHIHGTRIGDIHDRHCSLHNITRRFRELVETIHSLWNPEFEKLSDSEVFSLIDQELYLGEPTENRSQYAVFDFLTNDGEMLDGTKTFIFCRRNREIHVLFQFRDPAVHSHLCSVDIFARLPALTSSGLTNNGSHLFPSIFRSIKSAGKLPQILDRDR